MNSAAPIAYVIESAENWLACIRFANRLLRGGNRVLYVTSHSAQISDQAPIASGSFLIPLSPAADPGLAAPQDGFGISRIAQGHGVELHPVFSGGVVASPLASIRVGLYGGGGAPFNQAGILAECGFAIRFLNDSEIRAGALSEVDVLVVPGGGFRAMHGQLEPLGEDGCRAIADFVRRGGMYIGSCAGSYDCVIAPDDFVTSCPAQRHLQLINVRVWNDASVDFGALQSPGVGVVRIRNERPDHPVMFGLPEEFEIAHYNGPIFDPVAPAIAGASEAAGLASFVGVTARFTPSEAFAGAIEPGTQTLVQRAIAAGRFSAVAGFLGEGRVVAFGSHPEFGFDLPMAEWGQPARLLANAVLWQSSSRSVGSVSRVDRLPDGSMTFPIGSSLDEVRAAATAIQDHAERLRKRGVEPPPSWLNPDYALSLFGESPVAIWDQSLDDMQRMAGEISERAVALRSRIGEAMAMRTDELTRTAVTTIEHWMIDERPAEWQQDGGYHGVIALLRTADRMCDAAVKRWSEELGPSAGAYAYLHENPYHLVAGSYLAAVGCVAGALQLMRAAIAELEMADDLSRDRQVVRRGATSADAARDLSPAVA